ncbi:MAG: CBS domain-containing protein [Myxococcota bacterium]
MSHFQMPVADYMSAPLIAIGESETLDDADRLLHDKGITAAAVMAPDGSIAGVISRTDLLRAGEIESGEALRLPQQRVGEVMTAPALTVDSADPLSTAAKLMHKKRIHRVFVTRGGEPVGVLSTRDLLRVICEVDLRTPIGEIASKGIIRVNAEDPVALAVDRLEVANKHGLVVVQGEWPVGTFGQGDALLARAVEPRLPVEKVMNLRIVALPPTMPISRAGAQALALGARRILVVGHGIEGIVSGLDFARLAA